MIFLLISSLESDSSEDEVPKKSPVRPAPKIVKPPVNSSDKNKEVLPKKANAKITKEGSKSNIPASETSSSDSDSSSSEEEQSKPVLKSAGKSPGSSSKVVKKQAAANSSSSSDSSSDEEPKKVEVDLKKKVKISCNTSEKKKPKAASTPVGKISASRSPASKASSDEDSSSSDEKTVNGGRSPLVEVLIVQHMKPFSILQLYLM